VQLLTGAGHRLAEKCIVPDDIYRIRAVVSRWIADANINAAITTGGTGITGRDSSPEAVSVLFDKQIDGFGEVFRAVSCEEINTSTIRSRAIAGVTNATFIFCLPGSTGACRTDWGRLISHQLDYDMRPCHLVELVPRGAGAGLNRYGGDCAASQDKTNSVISTALLRSSIGRFPVSSAVSAATAMMSESIGYSRG
jgi:molybdopterin adenylyltransferase